MKKKATVLTIVSHLLSQCGIAMIVYLFSLHLKWVHQAKTYEETEINAIMIGMICTFAVLFLIILDFVLTSMILYKLEKPNWWWHMFGLSIPVATWLLFFIMLWGTTMPSLVCVNISFVGINFSMIERMLLISGFSIKTLKRYSIGCFAKKALKYLGIIALHTAFTLSALGLSVLFFLVLSGATESTYQQMPHLMNGSIISEKLLFLPIVLSICTIVGPTAKEFVLFYLCSKKLYGRWYLHVIDLWVCVYVQVFILVVTISACVANVNSIITSDYFITIPIMISVIMSRCVLIVLMESKCVIKSPFRHSKTEEGEEFDNSRV